MLSWPRDALQTCVASLAFVCSGGVLWACSDNIIVFGRSLGGAVTINLLAQHGARVCSALPAFLWKQSSCWQEC